MILEIDMAEANIIHYALEYTGLCTQIPFAQNEYHLLIERIYKLIKEECEKDNG